MKFARTPNVFAVTVRLAALFGLICCLWAGSVGTGRAQEPVWSSVGMLNTPRSSHTTTLLPNGQVLVIGGVNDQGALITAELFDPQTNLFAVTGSLNAARADHTAALLSNGQVLVVGGTDASGNILDSAELYDPTTGQFTLTGNLNLARYLHTATLLPNGQVLVVGGMDGNYRSTDIAELYDPVTGQFSITGSIGTARQQHTATLLSNGQVLIAGGWHDVQPVGNAVNQAELYDPQTQLFTNTGELAVARFDFTASLLANEQVLVAGGWDSSGNPTNSTELYDPQSGQFNDTGSLNIGRGQHTATLLPNDQILIAGGNNDQATDSAELYNPQTGLFTITGSLNLARCEHTATLLSSGQVLVVGGGCNETVGLMELYDLDTGRFTTAAGSLNTGRFEHTATLLPNGQVLVVGGSDDLEFTFESAELYDPQTKQFVFTNALSTERSQHTATLLSNGRVLIAGGLRSGGTTTSAELYDSQINVFTPTGSLSQGRYGHAATLLLNGQVLIAGGFDSGGSSIDSAELYDPQTGQFTAAQTLNTPRAYHTATLLPDGKVLIVGGVDRNYSTLDDAELYDPETNVFTSTGTMNFRRYQHTATLLPNGMVLILGGYDEGYGPQAGAELYDPQTGQFLEAGELVMARYQHTATLLPDGQVLIVGGWDDQSMSIAATELYDYQTGQFTSTPDLNTDRHKHTATLLPNGQVLIVGGHSFSLGKVLTNAELYTVPGTSPNTAEGNNVEVLPVDTTTGTSPVTVTFSIVSQNGITTLTTSSVGPTPPAGFSLGDPATYYDISTTASYTSPITICINYNPASYSNPGSLQLLHYENDTWENVTTSNDVGGVICGSVTSLSPFVIAFPTTSANLPPTVDASGPYSVDEGGFVNLTASGTDPEGETLTFAWDLDNDGTFETSGQSVTFSAASLDGPSSYMVTVRATDSGGLSVTYQTTVAVLNVAPIASLSSDGPISEGSPATISFSYPSDPSSADIAAGFHYVFSCDGSALDDATYATSGTAATHTCAFDDGPSTHTVQARILDKDGGYNEYTTNVTVNNASPTASFTASSSVSEGDLISLTLTNPSDPSGADMAAGFTYAFNCGSGYGAPGGTNTTTCSAVDSPSQTVKGKIIDKDGAYAEYTVVVAVNNVAPLIGDIVAPLDPQLANTLISASAVFTDTGALDTHTAVWDWGDASTSAGGVNEVNGSGSVSGSHPYTTAGVYTITLTITDKDGGSTQAFFRYVVVYDPSVGFVTGGGWINSPAGACRLTTVCEGATGKANFGFVAKYQQGANVPTGNTDFNFKAGNLNFKSTEYQWLVVAGAKAQYKGFGTINGSGEYGFMLTAIDGQQNGGGGVDKFRIKIWDKATGEIVYDNQMGAADDAPPITAIGGGSVVIHKD